MGPVYQRPRPFVIGLSAGVGELLICSPESERDEAVSGGSPKLPGVAIWRVVAQRRVQLSRIVEAIDISRDGLAGPVPTGVRIDSLLS